MAAILLVVAATWALGGFEYAPALEPKQAFGTKIDAGEYSVVIERARLRAPTPDERTSLTYKGTPRWTHLVEVDLRVRNQSDRSLLSLGRALEWEIDGVYEPVIEGVSHDEYDRRDSTELGHPPGVWLRMRGLRPVPRQLHPVRRISIHVMAIEYHDMGRAFGNILDFRAVRPIAVVDVPVGGARS